MEENYPYVKDIEVTTEEKEVIIAPSFKMVVLPEVDCQVSLNDNKHYKKYPKGRMIPIELNSKIEKPINRIFIKGEEGLCGIWGYR